MIPTVKKRSDGGDSGVDSGTTFREIVIPEIVISGQITSESAFYFGVLP